MLDKVVAAAKGRDGGVRLVMSAESCESAAWPPIEQAVTQLGFACVRLDETNETDRGRLCHRHVVLICTRTDQLADAIVWIRQLASTSPRLHIVVWAAPPPAVVADVGWTRHVTAGVAKVDAIIARGELAQASACLYGLEAEAQLRGQPVPLSLRARRRQLVRLVDARSRYPERKPMVSMDGLSRLINLLEDAPDELSALTSACSWVRREAERVSVGIVSADGLRLVASHGWRTSDLSGVIASILRGPDADLRVTSTRKAPDGFGVSIRFGGATVGHVVIGPDDRHHPGLLPAAQAMAMLVGPTVRACLDVLEVGVDERDGLREILGRSQVMIDVRMAIARAAATNFPVLVEGESGTGKELVARALHRLSARRERRFIAVNCAALTDDLVEAELFGHTRGAFTGAVGPRAGLFEEAHGGTLLLDEVSELSPRAQAKLLRVLQEREVRRVGENVARPVDVRIVAATNMPLSEAVANDRFRSDLRFRLAVVPIRLPALRDRLEDLPLLAHVFWRRALSETGKRAYLGPDALAQLTRHRWPGNIRELQNIISGLAVAAPACGRVTARHVSHVIEHISGAGADDPPALPLDAARRVFERRLVARALARHAGRRSAAAHDLGLTRQGLAKALRRLGLSGEEDAAGVA